MVRFWIIGIVVAVAFTLFSLVDAAMSDAARTRGVSKPVWIVLIVLLPVIGGALWFLVGKGKPLVTGPAGIAPDDDPRFTGVRPDQEEMDARFKELQEQLLALDDETFPGETPSAPSAHAASQTDAASKADAVAGQQRAESEHGGPEHDAPEHDAPEHGDLPATGDTPPAGDAPRDGGPAAR